MLRHSLRHLRLHRFLSASLRRPPPQPQVPRFKWPSRRQRLPHSSPRPHLSHWVPPPPPCRSAVQRSKLRLRPLRLLHRPFPLARVLAAPPSACHLSPQRPHLRHLLLAPRSPSGQVPAARPSACRRSQRLLRHLLLLWVPLQLVRPLACHHSPAHPHQLPSPPRLPPQKIGRRSPQPVARIRLPFPFCSRPSRSNELPLLQTRRQHRHCRLAHLSSLL